MKIGLFTHVTSPLINGVAVSVEELAKELKRRNHEVTIISNNYEKFSNDFSNDEKIKVMSIPIFYQNLRTPVLVNPKLFKKLSKLNFDVVHSHSDFGHAMLARRYARIHNVPLIHTYHCDYLGYAKKNFGKYSNLVFYEPVKLYTKILCKTADRMIVPSFEIKHLLEDKFGIKKELDIIPNGVNLQVFSNLSNTEELRKKFNISDDDFVILSLSRLSKEKGISDIIRLLPELKELDKLKLLIVGGGPEEQSLKKLAQELGLNNVIFTGQVPHDRVQDYYALGTVFITNSRAETQGLSVTESLVSSIVPICPNIPIYQELIDDNENGFLFDSKEELIKIIKSCYYDRKNLSMMRSKARESTYRFSIDREVEQIEKIYKEEIIKKRYYK